MSYLQEAVAEYASQHGRLDTEREWILSPFDSWERNPFYTGPKGRHPEDDGYDDEPVTPGVYPPEAEWDDIPY